MIYEFTKVVEIEADSEEGAREQLQKSLNKREIKADSFELRVIDTARPEKRLRLVSKKKGLFIEGYPNQRGALDSIRKALKREFINARIKEVEQTEPKRIKPYTIYKVEKEEIIEVGSKFMESSYWDYFFRFTDEDRKNPNCFSQVRDVT